MSPAIQDSGEPTRARRLGKLAMLAWFIGGMLLIASSVLGQTGSFAWLSAWQHRLFGTDDVLLAVLPGMVLLLAPMFVVDALRRRSGHPFLAGLKDGVDALTKARSPDSLPDPRRALLRRARVHLALALACALGAAVGYVAVLRTTGRHQGEPLPALDYAAAAAPGAALPPYARLAGTVAQDGAAWVHEYTFRSDRHHDIYTPLTGPAWQAGQPVALLMEDVLFVHDDGTWRTPPAALEGSLARDAVPAWMVEEMRRAGLRVADDPVLLRRERLDGTMPGPDTIGATIPVMLGGSGVFTFLLMAWTAYRQRRRYLA